MKCIGPATMHGASQEIHGGDQRGVELCRALGILYWLRMEAIRADRVDAGTYLVFYSVQPGADGVAAPVFALFYGVKHKVRGMGCGCGLRSPGSRR